jgi:hypothetical protein
VCVYKQLNINEVTRGERSLAPIRRGGRLLAPTSPFYYNCYRVWREDAFPNSRDFVNFVRSSRLNTLLVWSFNGLRMTGEKNREYENVRK